MSDLNGNDILNQISAIALLFNDKELKKHFSLDAAKVFRKVANRIEKAYNRDKDEPETETK